jgi:hypothetical protein
MKERKQMINGKKERSAPQERRQSISPKEIAPPPTSFESFPIKEGNDEPKDGAVGVARSPPTTTQHQEKTKEDSRNQPMVFH